MNSVDNLIKEFEEKSKNAVSSNRPLWEGTDMDNNYNVDIHIWRKPGMGNSLQTIVGNKISILTATMSYLQVLLDKEVMTEEELDGIVSYIKKVEHERNK